jgi:predicted RND superfamily exporter protein
MVAGCGKNLIRNGLPKEEVKVEEEKQADPIKSEEVKAIEPVKEKEPVKTGEVKVKKEISNWTKKEKGMVALCALGGIVLVGYIIYQSIVKSIDWLAPFKKRMPTPNTNINAPDNNINLNG